MTKRIEELEEIIRGQSAFLEELYRAAGFYTGEAISVAALIARLRHGAMGKPQTKRQKRIAPSTGGSGITSAPFHPLL